MIPEWATPHIHPDVEWWATQKEIDKAVDTVNEEIDRIIYDDQPIGGYLKP